MATKVSDSQKHSAAHVLATAICRLYRNVKVGIGPVTKDGFYYDFELEQTITEDDFPVIEAEINKILQSNLKFQQVYLDRDQSINLLLQRGQIYKAELLKSIPDEEVSFFKTGEEFVDLCRGPHVSSTNSIGVITLTRVEKSFWNDDPKRPEMVRIYGKVFRGIDDLTEYRKLQEDLKNKNYLNLSKKYHYASIDKENDLVLTERGTSIFKKIEGIFNEKFNKSDYREVYFTKSFSNEFELDSAFKSILNTENSSYKDFPYKYSFKANLDSLSFEKGIKRLQVLSFRSLSVNKESEIAKDFGEQFDSLIQSFKVFNIDFSVDIYSANFDDNFAKQISAFLQRKIISHNKIIKNTKDIFAFIKITDIYEKEWILGEIKIKEEKGNTIVISQFNIHLTELWKYLIENSSGVMPKFLNPVDIICIPINKNYYAYAKRVVDILSKEGFSAFVNNRAKSFNRKIRDAEYLRIPFQIVVGQKEEASSSVSLRENGSDAGLISIESLIHKINDSLTR